jgi:hypothetical protein
MGTYDITEHAAGTKVARNSDRSRFATIRLTITRNRNGTGTVSVILRDMRGGLMTDTRLAVCSIPMMPGTQAAVDALAALQDGLDTVTGRIHER